MRMTHHPFAADLQVRRVAKSEGAASWTITDWPDDNGGWEPFQQEDSPFNEVNAPFPKEALINIDDDSSTSSQALRRNFESKELNQASATDASMIPTVSNKKSSTSTIEMRRAAYLNSISGGSTSEVQQERWSPSCSEQRQDQEGNKVTSTTWAEANDDGRDDDSAILGIQPRDEAITSTETSLRVRDQGFDDAMVEAPETETSANTLNRDFGDRSRRKFAWKDGSLLTSLNEGGCKAELSSEISYVLRASLALHPSLPVDAVSSIKNFGCNTSFEGAMIRNSLMWLSGLSETESNAELNLLVAAGYVVATAELGRDCFDTAGMYRFATRKELESSHDVLAKDELSNTAGTFEHLICTSLKTALDMPEEVVFLSDAIVYRAIVVAQEKRSAGGEYDITQEVKDLLDSIEGLEDLTFTVPDIVSLVGICRDYKADEETSERMDDNKGDKALEQNDTVAEILHVLYAEYRKRVRSDVSDFLRQSAWERTDLKLVVNSDGRLNTSFPQQFYSLVHSHLKTAIETLPSSFVSDIIVDILLDIQTAVIVTREKLESDWETLDVEGLCTVINDSLTMRGHIKSLSIFEDFAKNQDSLPEFKFNKIQEDIIKSYQELLQEATQLVARSIMKDLERPVMDLIFSAMWEQDDCFMSTATATLDDYFSDLNEWIPSVEFNHVVIRCVDILIKDYIKAAFAEWHSNRPFLDPEAVSSRIFQDRLILLAYFYSVEDKMNVTLLKDHAEMSLEILLLLSQIAGAKDPSDIPVEINSFCEIVGSRSGKAAIMHMVTRKMGTDHDDVLATWEEIVMREDSTSKEAQLDVNLGHLIRTKSMESASDSVNENSNNSVRNMNSCADASADGFCWILDTSTDLLNDLYHHCYGSPNIKTSQTTKPRNKESTQKQRNSDGNIETDNIPEGAKDGDQAKNAADNKVAKKKKWRPFKVGRRRAKS